MFVHFLISYICFLPDSDKFENKILTQIIITRKYFNNSGAI